MNGAPGAGRPGPLLRRSLSLPLLVLYGLGTTVGAGIYALLGVVAGEAGLHTPVAFVLAAGLAAFSALSFGELSARFPRSAGEAVYVREGLGWPGLDVAVGLAVALAGTVSAATIANGFAGYLGVFVDWPRPVVLAGLAALLGAVAAWGIRQSAWIAAGMTLLEVGGLLLVIAVAHDAWGTLPARWPELVPAPDVAVWGGIASATFLAFYAFLGFEDMVNVAEEVVDVQRRMPQAIALTLGLTLLLYAALAVTCVLAVPPEVLAASEAPLALVYAHATGSAPAALGLVSIVAMVNGGLVQVILASRVLYGLADQGSLPTWIGRVSARTRTPVRATWAVAAVVAALSVAFPLATLARATSFVTLAVFTLVNASLWRIKRRAPAAPGTATLPAWVPAAGALVSLALLAVESSRLLAR